MDLELTDAIAVLERTPETFRALLAGLPAAWTESNEGGDSWSPFVIMGHLVHGERTDLSAAAAARRVGRARPGPCCTNGAGDGEAVRRSCRTVAGVSARADALTV